MKLFRRISVLTLVLILVCLYCTSAFAEDHSVVHHFAEESIMEEGARLSRTSSTAWLKIEYAPGLTYSNLEVQCDYIYLPETGNPAGGSAESLSGGDYCSVDVVANSSTGICAFISGSYSFYARYDAYAGPVNYIRERLMLSA